MKISQEQLMTQIAESAVEYQLAETKRNSLRRELNANAGQAVARP